MIRAARPEEAALLSALALRSKGHWGYDADFLERCRAELTLKPEEIDGRPTSVYREGKRVLGFYALELSGDAADVAHFFVAPEAIGRGIGRALWHHLVETALERGVIRLSVAADPFAEGFYARMGLRRAGERPSGSIPGRTLPYLEMSLLSA